MSLELVIGNKNYSSWSLRAWLLLREAGIEFDEIRIPLDQPDTRERILAVSPAGFVPVLRSGAEIVWDTLAIAETVSERWPDRGLWPDDAAERARARSISAEMHAGFAVLREAMPMNCRAMGRKVTMTAALAADIGRVIDIWTDALKGRTGPTWLFGRFSVADAMFAPVVLRFRTYGVEVPDVAAAYPKRLLQSKPMQEWLAAAESETEVIRREEAGQ